MLFRLGEVSGKVMIDGILISDLTLKELRKSISVIPQVCDMYAKSSVWMARLDQSQFPTQTEKLNILVSNMAPYKEEYGPYTARIIPYSSLLEVMSNICHS